MRKHGRDGPALPAPLLTMHREQTFLGRGAQNTSINRTLGEVFSKFKPHLLVVLGDRSEILAAVTAAVITNIPVAHIRR